MDTELTLTAAITIKFLPYPPLKGACKSVLSIKQVLVTVLGNQINNHFLLHLGNTSPVYTSH